MIVDAGYYNGKEYVEDLTYFFFDELTEQEKKEILENEHKQRSDDCAA